MPFSLLGRKMRLNVRFWGECLLEIGPIGCYKMTILDKLLWGLRNAIPDSQDALCAHRLDPLGIAADGLQQCQANRGGLSSASSAAHESAEAVDAAGTCSIGSRPPRGIYAHDASR